VLIIGAGFGGLRLARALRRVPVDVTVIDRHNYHLFVPLLYQVATAGLEAESIAQPVRRILRGSPNARFRLAEAEDVDFARQVVFTNHGELPYDYLVIAAGSATNYYGLESVARRTSGLRTLDDAEEVRDRVLRMFEQAAVTASDQARGELMTMVIVGGGPTGVELAGALAELRAHALPKDFPGLDLSQTRILLVESAGRLLPGFPDMSRDRAAAQLRAMSVELRFGAEVASADDHGVTLADGERIPAGVVIWVAGMRAPRLADALHVLQGASGRVVVDETLQLPGHPEVFVIGDMAHLGKPEEKPHPMMAPVAIQQADLVAKNIDRLLRGQQPQPFSYKSSGTMVTIGRRAAIANVFGLQLSGLVAWVLWLTVHLYWLIGFRNRLLVLINWIWNYFTYERGVRLIRGR
jgi:NADH dehydrogenase